MKLLLLFVCYFAVAYGWTSLERVPIDPANPDLCVNEKIGTMKDGETKTLQGECVRASCSPGVISYAGCGVIGLREGCVLGPEDLSKPYPDCCPGEVCPNN
ncbi:hypothetical protein RN001_011727 [Aquatica leii]|uniref:Single domain-containing protein n=1 Tax=Aquatica leii TaxID=1421715 RepID=A0AAN7NXP3_9COLE|nr:hypothetical protein RN001_011727 [Aquatica leii]